MNPLFTEEEFSLLSNLPEASKVDEESDEFQNVVKSFYETIQEYHSKIRIIQVKYNELYILNKLFGVSELTLFSPGGEADESTAVQSVQVEEGERTAARHVSANRTDPLPWHKRVECEGDLHSWIQQKLLWKEWCVFLMPMFSCLTQFVLSWGIHF